MLTFSSIKSSLVTPDKYTYNPYKFDDLLGKKFDDIYRNHIHLFTFLIALSKNGNRESPYQTQFLL